MATLEECRAALDDFAAKMAAGAGDRKPPALDRSVSVRLTDLGSGYRARLSDGALHGITPGDDPKAQIKMALTSDDLLALTRGDLPFASAWASGRVKVDASMFDLLKLRALL
jgi:hypothetical protein